MLLFGATGFERTRVNTRILVDQSRFLTAGAGMWYPAWWLLKSTFSDRSRATGESHIYTAAKQMVESARQDTSHTFLQPKGEWWRQHVVLPPALERCIIKACLQKKKKKRLRGRRKKESLWLTHPASLSETTHQKQLPWVGLFFINACYLSSHWIRTFPFQFLPQIFAPPTQTHPVNPPGRVAKVSEKASKDAAFWIFFSWDLWMRRARDDHRVEYWLLACYGLTYAALKLAATHTHFSFITRR